jgi:outer membrane protein OmpA-like peptidoglycan-associated protein
MGFARLLPIFLLVGVASPTRAADVRAGRGGNTFTLGAFAGGHVFAEGTNLGVVGGEQNPDGAKDGMLGGLRASVGLGRWLVAEAELAGLATEDRIYMRKARVLGYRINALAPLRGGDFRPFVLVGAGAMQVASTDAQGSSGLALDTKAEVHTGIGFDYRLLDGVSVRGDARVLQVPSKENWGLTTDVEAMLGASVSFGDRGRWSQRVEEVLAPIAQAPAHPATPFREPMPQPEKVVRASPAPPEPKPPTRGAASMAPADVADEDVAAATVSSVSDLLERAREVKFESGTTNLTQASLVFLSELATALAKEPAARLEIMVHTANGGDAKKDLSFSRRRAEAIKYVLVADGANVDQLIAIGRGSEDPIAPNLTRTGRMRNERVELHRAAPPVRGQ